jgi:hypothetical protein
MPTTPSKGYRENFKIRHPHYMRDKTRDWRIRVLKILGNKCSNCGCDDLRMLEINHLKIGKSGRPKLHGGSSGFYLKILDGRIPKEDLDVRCRVCNALHYCQKKFGDSSHKVIWEGE